MEQRLSIITLGVSDLERSRSFYKNLGWEIATEKNSENIIAFNLQAFVLALYPIEGIAKDAGLQMKLPSTPSFTMAYNVGSEAEVDRVIEEAKTIGAKIIKQPEKAFWGGYSGYFSDPDGYLWEVAFNPYSTPEKDGTFKWV